MLVKDIRHPERQLILFEKRRTNYKEQKERQKSWGVEIHPGEGVMKEKFPNIRKPSHQQVCGEFWNLRGQHNWEGRKKKRA